jgi:glycosyltransferase involved in cell wall biosynthesis
VNTAVYRPAGTRQPGPVRIGWSGSESTNTYCLPLLEPCMKEIARVHDVEFVVISNVDPRINWEGVRTRFLPWRAETEVQDLQLIDVGTMPLQDSEFERGKCGLKAIQYMALGVPAVVSPVGVNTEIVTDGHNGFHAATDGEWTHRLLALTESERLRRELGANARRTVEERYSHEVATRLLSSVFEGVLSATGTRAPTAMEERHRSSIAGSLPGSNG